MRLLAVADAESPVLTSLLTHKGLGSFDAVISCGDLSPTYLDYVASMANAPLYYVRGNHDTDARGYATIGGTPLDGRIVSVGGVRIAGLDGSFAYREGIVGYSEREMWVKALKLSMRALLAGNPDILVTHAPPRGYGDLPDLPHRGFSSFNWLLGRLKPRLMLHGHVHLSYGKVDRELLHQSGTRVVNSYGFWTYEA